MVRKKGKDGDGVSSPSAGAGPTTASPPVTKLAVPSLVDSLEGDLELTPQAAFLSKRKAKALSIKKKRSSRDFEVRSPLNSERGERIDKRIPRDLERGDVKK